MNVWTKTRYYIRNKRTRKFMSHPHQKRFSMPTAQGCYFYTVKDFAEADVAKFYPNCEVIEVRG